ncbi:MAG: type IV pilus twitching motility protein PilT, partial [Terrimesophilobacter sp.]
VLGDDDGIRPLAPNAGAGAPSGTPGLTLPPPQAAYQSAPAPTMTGAAAPQASASSVPASVDALMPPPVAAPLPPMPPPMMAGASQAAAAPAATMAPPVVAQAAPPLPPAQPPVMSPPVMSQPVAAQPVVPPFTAATPATAEPERVETGYSPHPNADPDLISALQEVVRLTASDLHLTSNAPPMLRVDGALTPVEGSHVWDRDRVSKALYSILTDAQREAFELHLELDFAFAISESARFRVNFYRQRDAVGGAFRLIPTEIKPLEQLGVPDTVARFATLSRGLVLVTGPTGSGKSTTLAALIDLVNRTRTDHIVTVEDPIEFMHGNKRSLVNQREVGSDTHSFNEALKHVLRQDPDVILIGELRDLETISVALTAAETGHLVFATLHTQDAAQSIDRIIDVFPPHQQAQVRAQLAATLQGVVCQTLVKLASGKGRVVATEVMVITPAIANLIREAKTYQIATVLQAGRELGMFSMDQHLAELVNKGKITHAAAMEKAHDYESLKALIHRADPGIDYSTQRPN